MNFVPNEKRPTKLCIVAEAPGKYEEYELKPLIGPSGILLFDTLARHGIVRNDCSLFNLAQTRVPGDNLYAYLKKEGWQGSLVNLDAVTDAILETKPNLVLCLGRAALWAARGYDESIANWRGSLFWSHLWNCKCVATFHPAAILRLYNNIQYFRMDIARVSVEYKTPKLTTLSRDLIVNLTKDEILAQLADIQTNKPTIALDIEGGYNTMSCISIATSPSHAFIIPFLQATRAPFWSESDNADIWAALSQVLADEAIPKVLQNYLYDGFILAACYGAPIRGLVDDTMLKHWELVAESKKSLAVQASLYTNEPYYKEDRGEPPGPKLWTYCCKDSAVTFEINEKLEHNLSPKAKAHYKMNVALLAPFNYCQVRGLRYDVAKCKQLCKDTQAIVYRFQHLLNLAAYPEHTFDLAKIAAICCYKKSVVLEPNDLLNEPKKAYQGTIHQIVALLNREELTATELGELSMLTNTHVNVESTKQMCRVLYKEMGLPAQYAKKTKALTADAHALLNLYIKTKKGDFVLAVLRIRALLSRLETLKARVDPDGRMRCSYNTVGTETGRVTCYKSNTGSGFNLQTATKSLRHLFLADDGHWIFQCDLKGADGWTVAAHCARLGDSTMLDDYLAGVKPANVIALMYERGAEVARYTREQLLEEQRNVNKDSWVYFACKRVQHGTNYMMQERTMSSQILNDSYKMTGTPTYVQLSTCARLQSLYLIRYSAVRQWHRWAQATLKSTGCLTGASGHKRIFFGRRNDQTTLKEFLADEPQENTTYATNLALLKLWNDPTNREDNQLIVQPLHQVHDALIGQFPMDKTDYAKAALHRWFNNELTIAEQKITIPFEGEYGRSWGELKHQI